MFAPRAKQTVALVLFMLCSTMPQMFAADDGFSLRTSVEEVRLTLVATDRHQRYVSDLAANELAIIDNEVVVRDFRSFFRASETRLNVFVLVDASYSINQRKRRDSANVVDAIRSSNWGDADSVSMLTFGTGDPNFSCVRNCSAKPVKLDPTPARARGLTPLFDTVLYSTKLLSESHQPDSKNILIVISDGIDNYSMRSLQDAVSALIHTEATAYAIDLNDPNSYSDGSTHLQEIARATGGISFPVEEGFAPILDKVLNDLRSSYVLTYVPPVRSQGVHAVQALPTRNLDLRFRTRQSYIYRSTTEAARATR